MIKRQKPPPQEARAAERPCVIDITYARSLKMHYLSLIMRAGLWGWAALVLWCSPSIAHEPPADEVPAAKEKNYVAAPMVLSNPNLGSGGGLMGIYFYNPAAENDSVSPPSSVTVMGLYTNTDTYFLGLFNQNYLKEDTWRLKTAILGGRIENDLDVPEFGNVQFASEIGAVGGSIERRVSGDFFVGLRAAYSKVDYLEGNALSGDYFELYMVENQKGGVIGASLSYDSRDNQRYPYRGIFSTLSFTSVPEKMGAKEGYYILEGNANAYHQIQSGHVVAVRGYGRFTPSDTPYAGLSTLGRRSDLRGYVSGELVAQNLISTQAEYRWFFLPKWGVVGFAGFAALYDGDVANITSDDIYISGGFGLRYRMHQENRVNFRVDFAWGEDDDSGFYVSLQEAF